MNGHARFAHVQLKLIFVSTILVIGPAAPARAQDLDDVSFSGVVADGNGAVVAGASVTARLAATGAERAAVTDEEGRYRLVELQPGAYTLRAVGAGFAAEESREVSTLAGQSVRLDFTLRPAALAAEQRTRSGTRWRRCLRRPERWGLRSRSTTTSTPPGPKTTAPVPPGVAIRRGAR